LCTAISSEDSEQLERLAKAHAPAFSGSAREVLAPDDTPKPARLGRKASRIHRLAQVGFGGIPESALDGSQLFDTGSGTVVAGIIGPNHVEPHPRGPMPQGVMNLGFIGQNPTLTPAPRFQCSPLDRFDSRNLNPFQPAVRLQVGNILHFEAVVDAPFFPEGELPGHAKEEEVVVRRELSLVPPGLPFDELQLPDD